MTRKQTIEKAVTWALQIAQDPVHGYDQTHRWGPDYDCSSLMISAWQQAGVPVKTAGATYTGNMAPVFLRCGFEDVTADVNLSTGAGLQRGDVLLNVRHHTAMSIGGGQIVHASINESGRATGGKTGDQTGREICVRSYYRYQSGWDKVLRYVGSWKKEEVEQVTQYAGIVKVSSYLNVRLGPGTRFGTVKLGGQEMRLPPGMVISIDKETDSWGRLTGTGYWVSLQYIQR
ncbi:NlpC/P60 family protein [Bacillota bacterium LCP21S3_D9]